MASNPLVVPISVDIRKAVAEFKKLQRFTTRTFKKIGRAAETVGNIVTGIASGTLIAEKAFQGLDKALDEIVKTGNNLERAKFFKVSIRDAEKLQRQLNGAISKQEAFNLLIEQTASGVPKSVTADIAKVTKALAFVSGLPESQLLEQLSKGEIAEDVLIKAGARAGELALATQRRANSLDRELSQYDKIQVALKVARTGAKRLGTSIDELAKKNIVSPITQLQNSLKDIVFGTLRALSPTIRKLITDLGGVKGITRSIDQFVSRKLIPGIKSIGEEIRKTIDSIRKEAKDSNKGIFEVLADRIADAMARGIALGIKKATGDAGKRALKFALSPFLSSKTATGTFEKSEQKRFAEIRKQQAARAVEFAKMLRGMAGIEPGQVKIPASIKQGSGDAPRLDKTKTKTGGGGRKGVSREAQEIAAERAGLQAQARALTRDFLSQSLNAISSLGGTISGVFSALKDLPERARIFLSTKKTREALLSVVQIIDKPLKQQLALIRSSTTLTDQQKKAATIFAITSKAGLDDQREYLRNQTTANAELKASNSFLQSNARLVELARQTNDRQTDVATSLRQLDLQRQTLLVRRTELLKQANGASSRQQKTLEAQVIILDSQLRRVNRFQKQYKEINRIQSIAIQLNQKLAALAKQQEIASANRQTFLIKQASVLAVDELKAQQLAAKGFQAQAALEQQQIAAKRQKLELDTKLLMVNQQLAQLQLQAQADAAKGNKDAAAAANKRVAALQIQQASISTQLDQQAKLNQQLVENARAATTFAGGLQSAFQDAIASAQNLENSIGKAIGNAARSIGEFVSNEIFSIGEAFGQLAAGMKGLDIGADFSTRGAQFLAGLAKQMGSFFLLAGTGLILTGEPSSVGRGIALAGLGGLLLAGGGFASGMSGASPGGSAVTASALNATRREPSAAPTTRQRQETNTTFLLFNTVPWDNKTEEQPRREFNAWNNRGGRTV